MIFFSNTDFTIMKAIGTVHVLKDLRFARQMPAEVVTIFHV